MVPARSLMMLSGVGLKPFSMVIEIGSPFWSICPEQPTRIHSRTRRGMHPGRSQCFTRLRSGFAASHSFSVGSGDVGGACSLVVGAAAADAFAEPVGVGAAVALAAAVAVAADGGAALVA